MKRVVTFLGTGTSQGVPVIGCSCPICLSTDPRDKRLRTSILYQEGKRNIIVDCGPDFRQQVLRTGIKELDAILLTHEHNDHIVGLDDVRPFNFMQRRDMPIYCTDQVAGELNQRFPYVFATNPYPGAPKVQLISINKDTPFKIHDILIQPIEVDHGQLMVLGFRFDDFTYITDIHTITEEELQKVLGTRILVLSALHQKPHHSHLSLDQALELIERIQPEQAYLTHISHRMGFHEEESKDLPSNVAFAYDGLRVEL